MGQVLVTLSYRWGELSTATALASSTLAWDVVLDTLLHSDDGMNQLLGCAIYLAGCIPLIVMTSQQTSVSIQKRVSFTDVEPSQQLNNPTI